MSTEQPLPPSMLRPSSLSPSRTMSGSCPSSSSRNVPMRTPRPRATLSRFCCPASRPGGPSSFRQALSARDRIEQFLPDCRHPSADCLCFQLNEIGPEEWRPDAPGVPASFPWIRL